MHSIIIRSVNAIHSRKGVYQKSKVKANPFISARYVCLSFTHQRLSNTRIHGMIGNDDAACKIYTTLSLMALLYIHILLLPSLTRLPRVRNGAKQRSLLQMAGAGAGAGAEAVL